jgi:di/tricarboxylate transporter
MATRETASDDRALRRTPVTGRVRRDETKPSFLTTEMWAFVASVVAILIAVAQADNFDAPRAWTLIAAVTIGYMVSRGLAKSGSAHRDQDTD